MSDDTGYETDNSEGQIDRLAWQQAAERRFAANPRSLLKTVVDSMQEERNDD